MIEPFSLKMPIFGKMKKVLSTETCLSEDFVSSSVAKPKFMRLFDLFILVIDHETLEQVIIANESVNFPFFKRLNNLNNF